MKGHDPLVPMVIALAAEGVIRYEARSLWAFWLWKASVLSWAKIVS